MFFSVIDGEPYADPMGRYRKGGGINLPVLIQVLIPRASLQGFCKGLTENGFNYNIIEH